MSTLDTSASETTTTYLDIGRAVTAEKYGASIAFERLTPPTGPSAIGFAGSLDDWEKSGWKVVSGPEPVEYSESTAREVLTKLRRVDSRAHAIRDVSRYVVKATGAASPPLGSSDQRLIADMTDLVLDRLEAWRAGDQQRVDEIDDGATWDARSVQALWSAAFGIAERSLNVLEDREPGAAQALIDNFRGQIADYRRP